MKARNTHVDIIKAVGILLVVLGHNWISLDAKGEVFRVIYSFHIPLFFFCSGLFFNGARPLLETVKGKADALLKPFFITAIIVALAYFLIKGENIAASLFHVAWADGKYMDWQQLWFLPHLFLLIVAAAVTASLFERFDLPVWLRLGVVAALFIAGIFSMNSPFEGIFTIMGQEFKVFGWPWTADILCVSLGFFFLGFYTREAVLNFRVDYFMLITSIVAFTACHIAFDETMDLNMRAYGAVFITTAQALIGMYLVIAFCYFLNKIKALRPVFVYIGQSTLWILIFHGYFQYKSFDVLRDSVGLNAYLSAALSFAIALAVSFAAMEGYRFAKKLITKVHN